MTTIKLFLNSKDGVNSAEPSQAQWNLDMRFNNTSSTGIKIDQFVVPNTVYPINTNNNSFVWLESGTGTPNTLSITPNLYTGTSLATYLSTNLTALSPDSRTYTVTYDSSSKKLSFSISSGTGRITSASTCLDELGVFSNFTFSTSSTMAPYVVSLSGSQYIDVRSSLSLSNVSSKGIYNLLARIPLDKEFGSLIYYRNYDDSFMSFSNQDIDNFEIALFDDKGHLWRLDPNETVSMVLYLKIE